MPPLDLTKFKSTPQPAPTQAGSLDLNQFKVAAPAVSPETPVTQEKDTYGALFPSKPTDTPVMAGLKAAGNLPTSIYGLAKGVGEIALHPVKTAQNLGGAVKGGGERLGRAILSKTPLAERVKQVPTSVDEQKFTALSTALKDRYGSLENLQKTATNDPAGFGLDILTALGAGAGAVGRGAEAAKAIEKVGGLVTKPVAKAVSGAGTLVGKTAKYSTTHLTGLNPETVTELLKNPEKFKNVGSEARIQTAKDVAKALDKRIHDLSGLGSEYQTLRESGGVVNVPRETIPNVLSKYGVKLDEKGKILTSAESRPLSPTDRNALQDFMDNYGKNEALSPNAFLNTREALSNLSKYESGKTNLSTSISRDLRHAYDELGKKQLSGLEALDKTYAPERQLVSQLKKDILTPQGDLKDGAISKIANITGKGKEKLLQRVKEVVPDIEDRIHVLKAAEDIEAAGGFKVGTYIRAGGAIFGGATGNIPVLVGSILAQPQLAVPLIKAAGITGDKLAPIVRALRTVANDVNNFRLPAPVLDFIRKPKAGASIEDVTKMGGQSTPSVIPKKKVSSASSSSVVDGLSVPGPVKKLRETLPENLKNNYEEFTRDLTLKGHDAAVQENSIHKYLSEKDELLDKYLEKNDRTANTDEARKFFTDVGYKGSNSAAVQEAASALGKDAWRYSLKKNKEPYATLFAGSSGSGKTTAVREVAPEINKSSAAIMDGNLSSYSSAKKRIVEANAAGKKVRIAYIYREPVDAWINGVVKRMKNNASEMGRIVPLSVFLSNLKGSWKTVSKLMDDGFKATLIDNSQGAGKAELMNRAKFDKISFSTDLKATLKTETKKLLDAGKITSEQYAALLK